MDSGSLGVPWITNNMYGARHRRRLYNTRQENSVAAKNLWGHISIQIFFFREFNHFAEFIISNIGSFSPFLHKRRFRNCSFYVDICVFVGWRPYVEYLGQRLPIYRSPSSSWRWTMGRVAYPRYDVRMFFGQHSYIAVAGIHWKWV